MEVNNTIKKYIKNMSGKVIGIGIDNKEFIESIDKNNKILECDLLNSINIKSFNGKKSKKKKYVKKLRKKYKKKNIDYMIINANMINKYLKKVVKDSIYINKKEIYYYMNKEYDIENITKRYKRYNTEIEVKEFIDGSLIKINTSKAKNHFIKDKIYYIMDTLNNIADVIGDILVS